MQGAGSPFLSKSWLRPSADFVIVTRNALQAKRRAPLPSSDTGLSPSALILPRFGRAPARTGSIRRCQSFGRAGMQSACPIESLTSSGAARYGTQSKTAGDRPCPNKASRKRPPIPIASAPFIVRCAARSSSRPWSRAPSCRKTRSANGSAPAAPSCAMRSANWRRRDWSSFAATVAPRLRPRAGTRRVTSSTRASRWNGW